MWLTRSVRTNAASMSSAIRVASSPSSGGEASRVPMICRRHLPAVAVRRLEGRGMA
jgi:hypothetical protein